MFSSKFPLTTIGLLAGAASVLAKPSTFANTTFSSVTVGQTWPISFSVGNGAPVSIAFGNMTWAFTVASDLSAPGVYPWLVSVPADTVAGRYQLALLQGNETEYSTPFDLVIPPTASQSTSSYPSASVSFSSNAVVTVTTTVTAIYLPAPTDAPTVTYIYYEDECACHKTSSCAATDVPTSLSRTAVTYFEEMCGCSTTITASCAETVMPVVQTQTEECDETSMLPTTMMPQTTAPGTAKVVATNTVMPTVACKTCDTMHPVYTGAANKVRGSGSGSGLGLAALMAIAVAA